MIERRNVHSIVYPRSAGARFGNIGSVLSARTPAFPGRAETGSPCATLPAAAPAVRSPVERVDRDLAAVIAQRARQEQREAERPNLAEQHRRKRVATRSGELIARPRRIVAGTLYSARVRGRLIFNI
jgi:hypothetical protein